MKPPRNALRRSSNAVVGTWVGVSLLVAGLTVTAPGSSFAADTTPAAGAAETAAPSAPSWQELGRRPGEGEQCLVCSQAIEGETSVEIRYKGRVFHVKESMLDAFRADPDAYFRKLQARSGLFDEAATDGPPMHSGWLYFGVYVAVGLLFGALCASLALGRGRRPLPWLLAGLVGNVVALAVLAMSPAAAAADGSGVPEPERGLGFLGRIATTRAPRDCPRCGASNHPAATACSACGAALEALVPAETDLTGPVGGADLGGAAP